MNKIIWCYWRKAKIIKDKMYLICGKDNFILKNMSILTVNKKYNITTTESWGGGRWI
jgi:hypothetical protein